MDNAQGTTTPKTKDNNHGNINGMCRIAVVVVPMGTTKNSDVAADPLLFA
jgi:hypothetical protein